MIEIHNEEDLADCECLLRQGIIPGQLDSYEYQDVKAAISAYLAGKEDNNIRLDTNE